MFGLPMAPELAPAPLSKLGLPMAKAAIWIRMLGSPIEVSSPEMLTEMRDWSEGRALTVGAMTVVKSSMVPSRAASVPMFWAFIIGSSFAGLSARFLKTFPV